MSDEYRAGLGIAAQRTGGQRVGIDELGWRSVAAYSARWL